MSLKLNSKSNGSTPLTIGTERSRGAKIKNSKQIPNPKIQTKDKIFFIVGPTAIGKSEVAVALAKKLNAEIISCDSMQVYKGMDIITSKPKGRLKKRVTHHLIDVIPPTKEYNVSRYRKHALNKIREIIKKSKTPLFVGGTGLYMSILIDGIFDSRIRNKAMRVRLLAQLAKEGSVDLHKRLREVDAEAANKIHPNDAKRIVRALEVFEATGKPISYLKKQRTGLSEVYDIKIFCLNMKRRQLYKKINERVNRMFDKGLVQELRRLLKLKLSQTASCAIGIKELKGYFDSLYGLEEAKRLIKRNTRLYAKRQLTWFRKDKRIKWIEVGEKETPLSVANRIIGTFPKGTP
jgi:tRNA dimethylallyltransferase